MNRWWSVHTHSRRSRNDALSTIPGLVDRAAELGYPALGLTDHGTPGGYVELYTACKKRGIAAAPGMELYLASDSALGSSKYMHLTVISYTTEGWRNVTALNNLAQEHFFHRPRVDMAQIAGLAEDARLQGIAIGTGCRSGPVVKALTERGPEAARQVLYALAGWFPRVYVELMQHEFAAEGMHDREITDALVQLANETGLPYIVTSDTHYTFEADKRLHDAYKELVVHDGVEIDDRPFSGNGYWLLSEEEQGARFDKHVFDTALGNLDDLAKALKVKIPELDTFQLKIPDVTLTGRQDEALAKRSWERLEKWLEEQDASKKLVKEAGDRLQAELDIITQSGFAGYLLLTMAITDYCWAERIWFYTRGSATGSFVLFVNGVTQENPLPSAHDIRFDRFLSPDRTSPPDVDIDIEHDRRDEVVEHFAKRYPTLRVGSTTTYGMTQEEDENGETSKGSLMQKYYKLQSKLDTGINNWSDVPPSEKDILLELAELNLVQGRGTHAGGYIMAEDESVTSLMPMEWITGSKSMVTALDKGDVEKLGLPKLDLLGSRVLTALRICCDLIAGGDGRQYYADIPLEDKATLKRCAAGNTVGLFQLGGWTNRKVCQQINPKKIKDLIAVQALARPAPMKSGFTKSYMRRKDKAEAVPSMHADIEAETKETYGLAIYQEQLVGVLRRLGLDALRLTRLLKAVKASGKAHALEAEKIMQEELEPLKDLARSKGWSEQDVAWLHGCLVDYGAGYSFGKAHSVQYGMTGYRTGYLAEHEPLAYWTGMLTAYEGVKEVRPPKDFVNLKLKAQARRDGVVVLGPHVNHSQVTFTADPDNFAVREGLGSVSHMTAAAAADIITKRPYASVVDFGQRVTTAVTCAARLVYGDSPAAVGGITSHLAAAGAFRDLPAGEPMRRAKGRIRRCKECKVTYATPLEYEDHVEEVHGDEAESAPAEVQSAAE